MKWAYYVKYKIKAVGVLFAILCVVLLLNIWTRKTYADLDASISSIYNDRLIPATYLFQITDHLYQKKLLHEQQNNIADHDFNTQHQHHNTAIAGLITNYEKTYLTTAEQLQFENFKSYLNAYHTSESKALQTGKADKYMEINFINMLQCLNQLSNIQVTEGKSLQKNSSAAISDNTLMSRLELSLLIVLGTLAIVLLSVSDKRIFQSVQDRSLN